MKTRIRKSHGGKFIVGHRSVHYHQIFSNVLLKRHVARSGNMHVRNSTKHFLNVKMASYAVPSFSLFDASIASVEDTEGKKKKQKHTGVDSIMSDTSAHSGIAREMDSGIPLELYQNISRLACINKVRLVKDGRFYSMNMVGGDPSVDKEFPVNQYPMGIYYGWFKVKIWRTSKTKKYNIQSGYVDEKNVLGFLIQKQTASSMCGRIVYLSSHDRKRTDNTYSRECEHPAENITLGENNTYERGEYKRCPSKKFIPTKPMVYIPFEVYDAMPYIPAYIPVNYPNPLKSEMRLNNTLSVSFKKNIKYTSTVSGGEDILKGLDGKQNALLENPENRRFYHESSVSETFNAETNISKDKRTLFNAVKTFILSKRTRKSNSLYAFDFKIRELYDIVTKAGFVMKDTKSFFRDSGLYTALQKAMDEFVSDVEYYKRQMSESTKTKRSDLLFYSETITKNEALYKNGKQVTAYVESQNVSMTLPIRLSLSTGTYTTKRRCYHALDGTFTDTETVHQANIAPVSSLLLGGKSMFKTMTRKTPVIKSSIVFSLYQNQLLNLIKTYNDNDNNYSMSTYMFSPNSLMKLFTHDPVNKCTRLLRVDLNDPSGDTSSVFQDMFIVTFTLPPYLSVKDSQDATVGNDTNFVALINSHGRCVYSDTYALFERACSRMEYELLSPLFNDKLKIPASRLDGYDAGDVDVDGNATVSVRPMVSEMGGTKHVIPLSSYLLKYLYSAIEEQKKAKTNQVQFLSDNERLRLEYAINEGMITLDGITDIQCVFTFQDGFNPGAYGQKYEFNNKVMDSTTEHNLIGKNPFKYCTLDVIRNKHVWSDSSGNVDKAFSFDHEPEYMTQWVMDSLDPLISSVLDIEQFPTMMINYAKDVDDKEKENNPSFVNYADSRYDPDGKIGSLHLHFKYGYFPLYMNIDAPYMR